VAWCRSTLLDANQGTVVGGQKGAAGIYVPAALDLCNKKFILLSEG